MRQATWRPIAVAAALGALLVAGEAAAQRAREQGRASSVQARKFAKAATRVRQGSVELISSQPIPQSRESLDRIVALCRTIDGIFAGMRPDHDAELLEVWVVDDRDTYLGVLSSVGGTDGGNSGGMFVYDGDSTRVFSHGWRWETIQHEVWHACCHIWVSNTPVWLDEGLAEVFGRGSPIGGTFAIGAISGSDIARVNSAIRSGSFEPLFAFMQRGASWDDRLKNGDASGRTQYLQAWAIAHFLLFGDDGRHRPKLNAMLRELDRGRSPQSAFSSAIAPDRATVAALERAIADHFASAVAFDPVQRHAALGRWAAAAAPADRDAAIASLVEANVFGTDRDRIRRILAAGLEFAKPKGQDLPAVRVPDYGGTIWTVSWRRDPKVEATTEAAGLLSEVSWSLR